MTKTKFTMEKLIAASIFCALIFISTAYLPRIPFAGGYVHIGDAFIYIAACILPLPFSAAAAFTGAALADALSGYIIWVPGTIIIKALLACMFSRKSGKILTVRNLFGTIFAGAITIAGYYLYEVLLTSSFTVPLPSIIYNSMQALASALIFVVLALALDRIDLKNKILK